MQTASAHHSAKALLEWYFAMGVDETLTEAPYSWRQALTIVKPENTSKLPVRTTSLHTAPPMQLQQEVAALAAAADSLEALREAILNYKGLAICRTATQAVFAEGAVDAPVMVIGEAPGAEEDRKGVPFCGQSGQLLNKMLAAIGLSRESNAYITNSLFWRPPGNRTPSTEEILTCKPLVEKHIFLKNPQVILLTGAVAVRAVLGQETAISRLRGKPHRYHNSLLNKEIPVIVTYHPSYLLRSPAQKKLAWQDILTLKATLKS
jgi:uracil-DNA glycosylase family 4